MLTEAEVQKIEQRATSPQSMDFNFSHYQQDVAALLTGYRQLQEELAELRHAVASETEASRFREKVMRQDCDQFRQAVEKAQEHIRWTAQTVHQAHHHDNGQDAMLWADCPKNSCKSALLMSTEITVCLDAARGRTG